MINYSTIMPFWPISKMVTCMMMTTMAECGLGGRPKQNANATRENLTGSNNCMSIDGNKSIRTRKDMLNEATKRGTMERRESDRRDKSQQKIIITSQDRINNTVFHRLGRRDAEELRSDGERG